MNRDIIAFTKYKFNVYGNKDIRSGKDSAVVGIVGKSKSLDFPTMLIFWSLVRNSVVLAVYLLFSVACFLTVHEHYYTGYRWWTVNANFFRNKQHSFLKSRRFLWKKRIVTWLFEGKQDIIGNKSIHQVYAFIKSKRKKAEKQKEKE